MQPGSSSSSPCDAVDPVTSVEPWFRPGGWRYAALNLPGLDEVDRLVVAVAAADGRVLIAPTNHRDGARTALIADPEGNAWELLAEGCGEADRNR